ncbi:mitogen-activated protein kinase kinase kinase 1b-like [Physcomitrium patens]|uniref:Uncharacterized protein n=1 Tax=Physcomitrium patens TaxID=3218 RepID=A0A2K1JVN3_PHYPA|nr:mitogen-activated protein kinase kinase kinase 1b-like [Physcomitrium patens]PNR45585.1 hypothetical protein PHYPA_015356 [Physcomitrium patens]|eukprot:XP_024388662.1 mitogen-activated protein kinase kinase kinase 1b-like [Physcomitrella patens]
MVEERGSSRSSRGGSWGSGEDGGSSHGGKGVPKLSRTVAKKIHKYDVSADHSDYEDDGSVHSTSSSGSRRNPLSKSIIQQQSFRVGANFEEDLKTLYELIGVSKPADLAISASDWQSRGKSIAYSQPLSSPSLSQEHGEASHSNDLKPSIIDFRSEAPAASPRELPVAPVKLDAHERMTYRSDYVNSQPQNHYGRKNSPSQRSPPPESFPAFDSSPSRLGREGYGLHRMQSDPVMPTLGALSPLGTGNAHPESAGSTATRRWSFDLVPGNHEGDYANMSQVVRDNLPSAAVAMPKNGLVRRSPIIRDPNRSNSSVSNPYAQRQYPNLAEEAESSAKPESSAIPDSSAMPELPAKLESTAVPELSAKPESNAKPESEPEQDSSVEARTEHYGSVRKSKIPSALPSALIIERNKARKYIVRLKSLSCFLRTEKILPQE